ncbi:acyltransferase [Chryseobacterium formosus]|uniref:Acyltransferase n=1 Tax=Chryseobacterium formosus TaxID=1537363 RepID=A0ABT3XPJ0_9FLAO|nr:acyltransferase [Chryseobacterium formosus]MCX8523561.1 acyltransferase [Chryseobacterium formosus]
MNFFDRGKLAILERILRTIPVRFKIGKIHFKSTFLSPIFIFNGKNVRIEKGVAIYPKCRMETHNGGSIVIEENTNIGQNFHIISGEQELRIGKNTTISGNVFITNLDHDYKEINKHILEQKHFVKKTLIGENCFIGYGAAIQAGTVLGKQCIVGTNSVVYGSFPDYCVIVGAPAKIIKRYSFEKQAWLKTDAKGNFIEI